LDGETSADFAFIADLDGEVVADRVIRVEDEADTDVEVAFAAG
jgi:hypothetical protein